MPSEALSTPGSEEFATGNGLRARRAFAGGEPSTDNDELGTGEGEESSPETI